MLVLGRESGQSGCCFKNCWFLEVIGRQKEPGDGFLLLLGGIFSVFNYGAYVGWVYLK